MEELLALMAIDCSAAAVTETANTFDVIPFDAAVMSLDPADSPFAKPAASMLTIVGFELVHVAVLLRS